MRARALVPAALTLTCSCQAFLVFTPEDRSPAADAALEGGAPDAPDAAVDVGPGASPTDAGCDAAYCADFEEGPDLQTYRLTSAPLSTARIAPCEREGNHCLEVEVHSKVVVSSAVAVSGSYVDWELAVGCVWADTDAPSGGFFSYVAYLELDDRFVWIACESAENGEVRIKADSTDPETGGSAPVQLGFSPLRIAVRARLAEGRVELFEGGGDSRIPRGSLALIGGPLTTRAPRAILHFGSPYGNFFRARFDDVRLGGGE